MTKKQQIKKLKEAIKKDEREAQKYRSHQQWIAILQTKETNLKNQITDLNRKLVETQAIIVKALTERFDFSDELTIQAAKDTLKKLESSL